MLAPPRRVANWEAATGLWLPDWRWLKAFAQSILNPAWHDTAAHQLSAIVARSLEVFAIAVEISPPSNSIMPRYCSL